MIYNQKFKQKVELDVCSMTIEELVEGTRVEVFNPKTFEGYQRKIEPNHCKKIVRYIEKEIQNTDSILMPSAIICARYKNKEENKLNLVDGQHRVEAFREIKIRDEKLYSKIKNIRIPTVIMQLDENQKDIEIDTFITINKTSKKVDTSLALILKNKIDRNSKDKDLVREKSEYLAVELAIKINDNPKSIFLHNTSSSE